MRVLDVILVFIGLSGEALSHMCLLEPKQRGTLNISVSNSPTCARHTPPCGGQEVEEPYATYAPGDEVFFKWQQNLNHYTPGYPGYYDISIAENPGSTNFTTLLVVSDKYVHAQDYQENFTAILSVPNMECEHCVIHARYVSNKPTELIFYQCADVKISRDVKPSTDATKFLHTKTHSELRRLLPLKRALKLKQTTDLKFNRKTTNDDVKLYGIAYNPLEPMKSSYISVGVDSGQTQTLATYDFGIDSPPGTTEAAKLNAYLIDEVVAVDSKRDTSYLIMHTDGARDDIAREVYSIGSRNGTILQMSEIFGLEGGPIAGLSWYTPGTSVAFRIQEYVGGYTFEVGILDFRGTYITKAGLPRAENLYVNFLWMDTQSDNAHIVYSLMGNEDRQDQLNAQIYTFDVNNGSYLRYVELDVSKYTFMSMHSYPGSGDTLFAFSPGLWFSETNTWEWSLVQVDTFNGTVTKKCQIAPAGMFDRTYGGSVNQGAQSSDGFLYHVLRVQNSQTDFVVGVNPVTCETRFSEPTNLRHVHSLQKPSS